MTVYVKDPHIAVFTGPSGCRKNNLVLDVIMN